MKEISWKVNYMQKKQADWTSGHPIPWILLAGKFRWITFHPQPSQISGFHWQQHQQRLPFILSKRFFFEPPVLIIEWHKKIEKPGDFLLSLVKFAHILWISNDCTSMSGETVKPIVIAPSRHPHLHSIEILLWSGPSHRNKRFERFCRKNWQKTFRKLWQNKLIWQKKTCKATLETGGNEAHIAMFWNPQDALNQHALQPHPGPLGQPDALGSAEISKRIWVETKRSFHHHTE